MSDIVSLAEARRRAGRETLGPAPCEAPAEATARLVAERDGAREEALAQRVRVVEDAAGAIVEINRALTMLRDLRDGLAHPLGDRPAVDLARAIDGELEGFAAALERCHRAIALVGTFARDGRAGWQVTPDGRARVDVRRLVAALAKLELVDPFEAARVDGVLPRAAEDQTTGGAPGDG